MFVVLINNNKIKGGEIHNPQRNRIRKFGSVFGASSARSARRSLRSLDSNAGSYAVVR